MSKHLRAVLVPLVITLATVGVLLFLGVWVNSLLDPFDDRPFDQTVWAAAEIAQDRLPMARDAIRHIPPGTSKERVRELLGEPDEAQSGYPPDSWGRGVKQFGRWSYWVGSSSALPPYGFDAAFLIVYFNRDGRVVSSEIYGG